MPRTLFTCGDSFAIEKFLSDLDRVLKSQNWAIVVVCEGIRDKAGRPVFEIEDASQADVLNRRMPGGVSRFLGQIVYQGIEDPLPGRQARSSRQGVDAPCFTAGFNRCRISRRGSCARSSCRAW